MKGGLKAKAVPVLKRALELAPDSAAIKKALEMASGEAGGEKQKQDQEQKKEQQKKEGGMFKSLFNKDSKDSKSS
jgi:hypothetical protein